MDFSETIGFIIGSILTGIAILIILWFLFVVGWYALIVVFLFWPVFLVLGIILLIFALIK